jgi:hypothetical protein
MKDALGQLADGQIEFYKSVSRDGKSGYPCPGVDARLGHGRMGQNHSGHAAHKGGHLRSPCTIRSPLFIVSVALVTGSCFPVHKLREWSACLSHSRSPLAAGAVCSCLVRSRGLPQLGADQLRGHGVSRRISARLITGRAPSDAVSPLPHFRYPRPPVLGPPRVRRPPTRPIGPSFKRKTRMANDVERRSSEELESAAAPLVRTTNLKCVRPSLPTAPPLIDPGG